MARIQLDKIAHSYKDKPEKDSDWALKELNQVWDDGGAYALLGPSGCGKTTLLNVISGLVTPSQGKILFDDDDVTRQNTAHRNIAQVFQFPVIYGTMTVYENLAFPLRNRHVDKTTVDQRVREVARMLDLTKVLKRRAHKLSADAKQKIALGRGLVRKDVAAILFDEPLTVIDPHQKTYLRQKLKEIHEQYKLTLVYVTHDQNEALTFADRVAVMNEGQVLQVGTPQELFEKPAHRFVGFFIGSPGMNFLPCKLGEGGATVDDVRIPIPGEILDKAGKSEGALEIGIRPEFIKLVNKDQSGIDMGVKSVEELGSFKIVTGQIGKHEIKVKIPEGESVEGNSCKVEFQETKTCLYADGSMVM